MLNDTKLSQKLPWNYKRYLFGLFIFVLSCFPTWVSNYYQPYIFKPISIALRVISGKIDGAIGEWVYLIICIVLIFRFINWVSRYHVQFIIPAYWYKQIIIIFNSLIKLYIFFELIWGLNYQKLSPATDFNITVPNSYTEAQMDSLSLVLIQNLNESRQQLSDSAIKSIKIDSILAQTITQFDLIDKAYPFLHYKRASVKIAKFPNWGDYFGYTAFYQPLTGEAIVRADLPILTQPFTVSHEIAHQLGYASETEANFIAFVIGKESKLPIFNYATELQLFTYAQIAQLNSIAKRGDYKQFENIIARNKKLLNPKVLADRKQIRDFFVHKQDLQIPGSAQFYDQFLQWNKQAKGVESYNDVLLWALAYKKQTP